eukprot:8179677-Pyramimonas_sp.AAC.1
MPGTQRQRDRLHKRVNEMFLGIQNAPTFVRGNLFIGELFLKMVLRCIKCVYLRSWACRPPPACGKRTSPPHGTPAIGSH